jgi:hypothetical protein
MVRTLTAADRLVDRRQGLPQWMRRGPGVCVPPNRLWQNQFGGLGAPRQRPADPHAALRSGRALSPTSIPAAVSDRCPDARGEGQEMNPEKNQRLWREEGLRFQPEIKTIIDGTLGNSSAARPSSITADRLTEQLDPWPLKPAFILLSYVMQRSRIGLQRNGRRGQWAMSVCTSLRAVG